MTSARSGARPGGVVEPATRSTGRLRCSGRGHQRQVADVRGYGLRGLFFSSIARRSLQIGWSKKLGLAHWSFMQLNIPNRTRPAHAWRGSVISAAAGATVATGAGAGVVAGAGSVFSACTGAGTTGATGTLTGACLATSSLGFTAALGGVATRTAADAALAGARATALADAARALG